MQKRKVVRGQPRNPSRSRTAHLGWHAAVQAPTARNRAAVWSGHLIRNLNVRSWLIVPTHLASANNGIVAKQMLVLPADDRPW